MNCLISISTLLYIKENLKWQPHIEEWLNFIIEELEESDLNSINELDWIHVNSNLENILPFFIESTKDFPFVFYDNLLNFPQIIENIENSWVGRIGTPLQILPDLYDGSFFQIAEAIQFIDMMFATLIPEEYDFNGKLDRLLFFIDRIKMDIFRSEKNQKMKKIQGITIPNHFFISNWKIMVFVDPAEENWLQVVENPLVIARQREKLLYDPLPKDIFGIYINNLVLILSPFRIIRSCYHYYLKRVNFLFDRSEKIKEDFSAFLLSKLDLMINSFEAKNISGFSPLIKDRKSKTQIEGDYFYLSDTTKLIIFSINEPIEANYHEFFPQFLHSRNDQKFTSHPFSHLSGLELTWKTKNNREISLKLDQIPNLELYEISLSGILVPEKEIILSSKKLVLSFWQMRSIFLESDPILFPLFLRFLRNPSVHSSLQIIYTNLLNIYEFFSKNGFGRVDLKNGLLLIDFNWDIYDWEKRLSKKILHHPNYLNPLTPMIIYLSEVYPNTDSTLKLSSGVYKTPSWIIDLHLFRIHLIIEEFEEYNKLIICINVLLYYFTKYNEEIINFLSNSENIKSNHQTFTFYFKIAKNTIQKVFKCKNKRKNKDFTVFCDTSNLQIAFSEVENNPEIKLPSLILGCIVTNKCPSNSDLSKFQELFRKYTKNIRKFHFIPIPYYGKSLQASPAPISIPDWSMKRSLSLIKEHLFTITPKNQTISGNELNSFYTKKIEKIRGILIQNLCYIEKMSWIRFLLQQFNDLEADRRSKHLKYAISIEKGTMEDDIEKLSSTLVEIATTSMSLRYLIELSVSVIKSKNAKILYNMEIYFESLNLCRIIVQYSSLKQEIISGITSKEVRFSETGDVTEMKSKSRVNLEKFYTVFSETKFQRIIKGNQQSDEFREFSKSETKFNDLVCKVNSEFQVEFGLSVSDVLNIYEQILAYLDENEDVVIVDKETMYKLIKEAIKDSKEERDNIAKVFLSNFSLESIELYTIDPMKTRSRPDRLLYKPIIKIDEKFILTLRLIEASKEIMLGIFLEGILPITFNNIKNKGLIKTIKNIRTFFNKLFEREVRRNTEKYFNIVIPHNLSNPGKIWKIKDFPPMEIDVFAIDTEIKAVLVIEAKDYQPPFSPYEIGREIKYFTDRKHNKRSIIEQNQFRCDSIRKCLKQILKHYGIDNYKDYSIFGLIVLSNVKHITFLKDIESSQIILNLEKFEEWLEQIRQRPNN